MTFVPTTEELAAFLEERPNHHRWGPDDQRGALNLITTERILAAVATVQLGETISMARPIAVKPARNNPKPAHHYMMDWIRESDPRAGSLTDYIGMAYHGQAYTHLDALCHQWDKGGMWGGVDPREQIRLDGARWGGIEHWSTGVIGRGVLLDVAAHRGVPHVTVDEPVHGSELEDIARSQGVDLHPGDIVAVHCGREDFDRTQPLPWGTKLGPDREMDDRRPGLHASCLWFFRDNDVAGLAWDMLDHKPYGYALPFTVHGAIFSLGMALFDNAMLEDIAMRCGQIGRYEFLFVSSPLIVIGGTGSPINPIAIL